MPQKISKITISLGLALILFILIPLLTLAQGGTVTVPANINSEWTPSTLTLTLNIKDYSFPADFDNGIINYRSDVTHTLRNMWTQINTDTFQWVQYIPPEVDRIWINTATPIIWWGNFEWLSSSSPPMLYRRPHPKITDIQPLRATPGDKICIIGENFKALPPGGVGSQLMVSIASTQGGVFWFDYYSPIWKIWWDTKICFTLPQLRPGIHNFLVTVANKNSAPPYSYDVWGKIFLPRILKNYPPLQPPPRPTPPR